MSVEITGLNQLLSRLQQELGAPEIERLSDTALINASQVFKRELVAQLSTFSGVPGTTGATVDEVTFTEPYNLDGSRTITVHWKGSKGRYRIIHLNEYGTVKNPNPKGKGKIDLAVRNSERAYIEAIRESIERGL